MPSGDRTPLRTVSAGNDSGQGDDNGENGSAMVEFIFLGLVLLVPVIYLIITAGQVQGAAFAAVGAAESAAKAYADAGEPDAGEQQARMAAELAFEDFGFEPESMLLDISCSAECLAPGSTVTALVSFDVPLPLMPGLPGMDFAPVTVDSSSTQAVGRYG